MTEDEDNLVAKLIEEEIGGGGSVIGGHSVSSVPTSIPSGHKQQQGTKSDKVFKLWCINVEFMVNFCIDFGMEWIQAPCTSSSQDQ